MKAKAKTGLLAARLSGVFTTTLHAQTAVFTHPGHVRNNGTPYPTSKQLTGNRVLSVFFFESTLCNH